MAREQTWVLVSDGVHARILRDIERGGATGEPLTLHSRAEPGPRTREPGRSFASAGGGRRAAMEPGTDPETHDMHAFARETLAVLDGHRRAGRLTRLAIFAAPRMLGILRQEMPAALATAVILERDANLVPLPVTDLHRRVSEALAAESRT